MKKSDVYAFLVNRHAGIQARYHGMRDGASGAGRYLSWIYLLWLNFCCYVLRRRTLEQNPLCEEWGDRTLPLERSESARAAGDLLSVEECVTRLERCDVVSFDLFDTLLFRPFDDPADVFFFVGERLGRLDFKRIRMQAERKVRARSAAQGKSAEITLEEIWRYLECETGIKAGEGMRVEQETELQFCYANPYMQQIFHRLQKQGKRIIVVSDMYLPAAFLRELLNRNGYEGVERLYVSCEYGTGKADGGLYDVVKKELGDAVRILHVGDHPGSDVAMAKRHGIAAWHYPNVHKKASPCRAFDLSPVVGSAYRGIVNAHLYAGAGTYGMEYEYGFVYGGLFVLGYCQFLHEYCAGHGIERLLFLSRDGDILKQVYDRLYPNEETAYALWSRMAAAKLMAAYDREDYFRRFLLQRVDQGKTIGQILDAMDLGELGVRLPEEIGREKPLTGRNAAAVRAFLEEQWTQVLACYAPQQEAAKRYYGKLLAGCQKACAVDIGWAGSGAVSLAFLVERVWKLPCRLTGAVAGTNTPHCEEPYASEIQLQSGQLVPYLYASSLNRDLWKRHEPGRGHNVYWELLLSSEQPHFRGFALGEDGEVRFRFGKTDRNPAGIRQIRQGILDFAERYRSHFEKVPYMYRISGRDAYAPMLAAMSDGERYLKQMRRRFDPNMDIGD